MLTMRPHPRSDHVRRRRARHEKRPDHVGVDHHAPGRGRDFPEAGRLGDKRLAHIFHAPAGVVDENVEPAEPFQRVGDETRAIVLARDVRKLANDAPLAEPSLGLGGHRLDLVALSRRRDDHAQARFREAQRHRPADAASAAGDDRHPRMERRCGHQALETVEKRYSTLSSESTGKP
jgi:hypothetical protein